MELIQRTSVSGIFCVVFGLRWCVCSSLTLSAEASMDIHSFLYLTLNINVPSSSALCFEDHFIGLC